MEHERSCNVLASQIGDGRAQQEDNEGKPHGREASMLRTALLTACRSGEPGPLQDPTRLLHGQDHSLSDTSLGDYILVIISH